MYRYLIFCFERIPRVPAADGIMIHQRIEHDTVLGLDLGCGVCQRPPFVQHLVLVVAPLVQCPRSVSQYRRGHRKLSAGRQWMEEKRPVTVGLDGTQGHAENSFFSPLKVEA